MKTGTVKFSKEFITPIGLKEWVTLDWDVDVPFDEKKAMETLSKVKEFVCNYQTSSPVFPDNSIPPGPPPIIQVKPEDREIGVTPEAILSCPDLIVLDTYRWLITANPELKRAYTLRHDQLKKLDKQ